MYCTECGSENKKNALYCKKCGAEFTKTLTADNYWKRLFRTRLGRTNYFVGFLLLIGTWFVYGLLLGFFDIPDGSEVESWGELILIIINFIYGLSITARRLHDLGKPEYYIFINLIPVANLIFIAYLFIGDSEAINKFGRPDKKGLNINKILALE